MPPVFLLNPDKWCGEMALKKALLDLYSIACIKDASMADY
jgi:hypothetical protein